MVGIFIHRWNADMVWRSSISWRREFERIGRKYTRMTLAALIRFVFLEFSGQARRHIRGADVGASDIAVAQIGTEDRGTIQTNRGKTFMVGSSRKMPDGQQARGI